MNQMSINMSLSAESQLSLIEKNIEGLDPGEEILLTFTQNPSEMLDLIQKSSGKSFLYEYLHRGPSEWSVLLRKRLSEGCCGCCGGE